ncbi:MAG TPA: MinD/ParA family protein [Thioalkalivibrio sp.]|nr:MinD/ParA family protein [Thioalkalivibrio sp.]
MAISSGKGGVGKSSLTVNLGITLARSGHRVCILDADTGLANVNILLGLRPEKSLEHVVSGDCRIDEILLDGPYGLKVIPGANGIPECVNLEPARKQRLIDEIDRIEGQFDYLLLDTAAGISDTTLDFVGAAHRILLIITPEPTSLTDAFSLLKLAVRRHPVECWIVVNFAGSFNEAQSVFQRFQGAVLKFLDVHVNYLGFVQLDESMRTAVSLQRPVALFPQTDPSARAFQRLADRLEETALPQQADHSFSRFWSRRLQEEQQGPERPAMTGSAPGSLPPASAREGCVQTPEVSEAAVAVAAPSASPESDGDSLAELRAEFDRILAKTEDPHRLAGWLESLHDAFIDRYGKPALTRPAWIERLTVQPAEHPEVSLDRPDCPAHDESEDVTSQSDAQPHESPGPARGVETITLAESKPDFGPPARPPTWETNAAPGRAASSPRTKLSHAYDANRFGSQEELLNRLRRTRHEGVNLWGVLKQL